MAISAVVGQARNFDAREAGTQASLRAVEHLGRNPVVLGFIFASHNLPLQQVLSGAAALLGDAPLVGFSTSAELTSQGQQQHSVVVALLTGSDITARADWFPGFGEDSRSTSQKMAHSLQLYQAYGTLFVVADGFHGDTKDLCAALPRGDYTLAGCLSGGELRQARTYQVGGRQSGFGGLAAALLAGKVASGIGLAHGWNEVGAYYKITRTRGAWVRTLNNQPAAETYASLFGYEAREWAYPPLNEMVRLYPLGIEQGKDKPLLVRSPLRMEADGSLRMHTSIPEGSIAHMLVGSMDACQKAAEKAAMQALKSLGKARPVLAVVLPDIAWQMLGETKPGREIEAVRSVIGPEVPIVGGYTLGQIAHSVGTGKKASSPELFNQNIEVVLIGEPSD